VKLAGNSKLVGGGGPLGAQLASHAPHRLASSHVRTDRRTQLAGAANIQKIAGKVRAVEERVPMPTSG
jgi:hypothetical protein